VQGCTADAWREKTAPRGTPWASVGKAYAKELAVLGDTYAWASDRPIEPLTEFTAVAHGRPLVAVGSGGSATAAHLATLLHRFRAGGFSRRATPLDLLLSEPNLHDAAVLILSASGKNRDVLAALDRSVCCESHAIATVCTQRGSPLASKARRFARSYVFEDDAPHGKDGFLATNSLLATCVFLARAYGVQSPGALPTGPNIESLGHLSAKHTAIVLHGGWSSPVATDLESKLNESAIASAQLSDYRNFGHGRHLWLARRAAETVVVALVTPETSDLAAKTRTLLPPDIPVIELQTSHDGPAGTIDLLVQGFQLVRLLGDLQSFDPGRPSVPAFGRKLYHLGPGSGTHDQLSPVSRKVARLGRLQANGSPEVARALNQFVESLASVKLGGLVLDYDGTLCGRNERFGALRDDVSAECVRLLEAGVVVGIATGRGRSVRESLQHAVPPELWKRVTVGYYNGGEIASLMRNEAPSRIASVEPPLDLALDLLERESVLIESASLTARRRQITVEPRRNLSTDALMSSVMTALGPVEHLGIRVLVSSHSVDVLPPGVGKLAVVHEVQQQVKKGTQTLCIGDRGSWPGNDVALLSHWPSLSVDEVSGSLATCWNLAPSGVTGPDAALRYLRALTVVDGIGSLDAQDLWRRP
jgi:hypothetical protein